MFTEKLKPVLTLIKKMIDGESEKRNKKKDKKKERKKYPYKHLGSSRTILYKDTA